MRCATARSGRSRIRYTKSAAATAATCNGTHMILSRIGIIGAGTMGAGIAQISAAAGLEVLMVDVSDAALDRGAASIRASLDRLVKKDKLSAEQHAAVRSRIRGSTQYSELATADLVIEAATENL